MKITILFKVSWIAGNLSVFRNFFVNEEKNRNLPKNLHKAFSWNFTEVFYHSCKEHNLSLYTSFFTELSSTSSSHEPLHNLNTFWLELKLQRRNRKKKVQRSCRNGQIDAHLQIPKRWRNDPLKTTYKIVTFRRTT